MIPYTSSLSCTFSLVPHNKHDCDMATADKYMRLCVERYLHLHFSFEYNQFYYGVELEFMLYCNKKKGKVRVLN
jgi:hypothetical protein